MDIRAEIIGGKAIALRHGPVQDVHALLGPQGKSFIQEDGTLVVQWVADAMKVLRNFGYSGHYAPSPISKSYHWPGLYKPMAHQKVTADFMTMNQRAFIFNDMGTGKTLAAVWASDFLRRNGKINRVLIVCPVSVVKAAWFNDIHKVLLDVHVGVCLGTRKQKQDVIKSDAKYVIIPYDSVATVAPELTKGEFDLIIADEATYIKNPKTIRSKALMSLVTSKTWVWAMTGTPVAQSPMDAHGLLLLCKGPTNGVPTTMSAFRAEVMDKDPYSEYGWLPKPDAFERVFGMLQPAIRYTKEECLDLPERTYQFREVEMGDLQQKHYNKLKKDGIIKLKEGVVTAVNAGVMMSKLLQVASGTVYAEDGETVIDFDNKARLDEMKAIIDGAAHKVIVFCAFRHSTKQVCEYLTECGITWDYINGSKTGNARAQTIDAFQEQKDPRVIVIQPKAASHGITLTAADTVIWFNPVTSVDVYLQANDRPHRQGQKNPCTVYHLVSCHVEKKLYAMLDKKIAGQDNLLEMYKSLMSDD